LSRVIDRLLAGLVAVALLLGSGAGSVTYWCAMNGARVDSACCCKHSNEPGATLDEESRAERPGCCGARVEAAVVAAATLELRSHFSDGAAVVATLALVPEPAQPALKDVVLPSRARGPPLSQGPPLYIKNCVLLS